MIGLGKLVGEGLGIVKRLIPDKEARAQRNADLNTEVIKAFGGSSYAGPNRTWFDSLVDGINRLMRPAIVFGVFYIFTMPFWPGDAGLTKFSAAMQAYNLVPEVFWNLLWIIVPSLFVVREIHHQRKKFKAPDPETVNKVLGNIRKIRELDKSRAIEKPSEDFRIETTDDMEDETKPLSNNAILEWNRKNNPDFNG